LGYDRLRTVKKNTHRKVRDTMIEEMDKVLYGYPAKGYVARAKAADRVFFISYHKEDMPSHAKFNFNSLEELLETMEKMAAFSDWKDLVTE
jgi:hypothetical protein